MRINSWKFTDDIINEIRSTWPWYYYLECAWTGMYFHNSCTLDSKDLTYDNWNCNKSSASLN